MHAPGPALLLGTLFACTLAAQKPDAVATPGLTWEKDLAAAHAAAKADGKPVVAYFTFET